jgi:hypothetical protein
VELGTWLRGWTKYAHAPGSSPSSTLDGTLSLLF